MKKTTLFMALVFGAFVANAQTNLLTNPSFEEWADGKPTGWLIPANESHASAITVTQEQTIVNDGTSSFKVVTDNTNNPAYQQTIPVTPGKTYTITINYYIESGDGTDARIWSNFKKGDTFFKDDELGAELLSALKGPGGTSKYFPDEKGAWKTYTVDVVAPANATDFAFEFRSYKGTTIYWDNMFFGEKEGGSGIENVTATTPSFFVQGSELLVSNVAEGTTVEIYNALGAKVQTSVCDGAAINVSDLAKGIYVVRAGNYAQKVMF